MAIEYSDKNAHPRMHVKIADNLAALLAGEYTPAYQCIAYLPDSLKGDFDALAWRLDHDLQDSEAGAQKIIDQEHLERYGSCVTGAEAQAVEKIISDMDQLRFLAPQRPVLLRVRAPFTGPTGDFRFHADGALPAFYSDQLLCNYNNPATEWICYEDALEDQEKTIIDGFGGGKGFFYTPKSDAPVYTFPLGTIWRHACRYRDAPVLPFLHRAHDIAEGTVPRLNLAATVFRYTKW